VDVSVRSLHTRTKTDSRVLRHADSLAKRCDWLGQCASDGEPSRDRNRLRTTTSSPPCLQVRFRTRSEQPCLFPPPEARCMENNQASIFKVKHPGVHPKVFLGSGRSPSAHPIITTMGARRSPVTKVSCEATDTSGSATTVFAFQATPVMSSEVFTRRE